LTAGGDEVDRRRTAVDRARGAAANRTLRYEKLLRRGTSFEVFCRVDAPADAELAEIAGVIATWRPLLGRGVSAGQGRATVSDVFSGRLDLATPHGLATWLTMDGPELVRAVATDHVDAQPVPSPRRIDVPLVLTGGPLHVGGTPPSSSRRNHTLTWKVNGKAAVPGSSIRGVVRSRTEYILRSLDVVVCEDGRCGSCWVCEVFGHGGGDDESSLVVGRRSRVRFLDSVVEGAVAKERVHLPVDRFTGGAREGLLFSLEGVEMGTAHLVIELDESLSADDERLLRALLRLIQQDLADCLIGIGGHVTRGYGGVEPQVKPLEASGDLPSLAEAQETQRQRWLTRQEVAQ
jgi:CRISPR/Cas system CSM-associated protein Csm3 (group 7 of RAMP superfamily)